MDNVMDSMMDNNNAFNRRVFRQNNMRPDNHVSPMIHASFGQTNTPTNQTVNFTNFVGNAGTSQAGTSTSSPMSYQNFANFYKGSPNK